MQQKPTKALDIVIRKAAEADAPGILRCLSCAFASYRQQYTPAGFLDTVLDAGRLRARMQHMHVLVAVSDGKVIGTVSGTAEGNGEGHLRGMAVLPEVAGTGLAAQLLSSVETWLRQKGCHRITLDTTEPLHAAMRFYEKHGYRRSGRVTDFFGMPLIEYVKELR